MSEDDRRGAREPLDAPPGAAGSSSAVAGRGRRRAAMALVVAGLVAGAASAPGCATTRTSGPDAPATRVTVGTRKLVEMGWDEPDTRFLREHIAQMERSPFDGCVFHVMYPGADGRDSNFTWQVWGRRAFTWAQLAPALADLEATPRTRFTELFLRVNATPGDVDWFDDFTPVATNLRLAARLAREGGCRGLFFDAEPYGRPLWFRRERPDRDRRSWEACARAARERGRAAMTAIQDEFPGVVLFMSGAYSIPWSQAWRWRAPLDDASYGLLAPFVDGMLDAARGETRLVDGHVATYGAQDPFRFQQVHRTMRDTVLAIVANPERYRRHVENGFGLWMDFEWQSRGWDTVRVDRNYFTPAGFERALEAALAHSDRYVWIYSESPRWWTETGRPWRLPPAYAEVLRRARAPD